MSITIKIRDIRDVAAGDAVYVYQRSCPRFYGYVRQLTGRKDCPFDFGSFRPVIRHLRFAYALRRIETTHPSTGWRGTCVDVL